MTRPETALRLEMSLADFSRDASIIAAFCRGGSEHTFSILNALHKEATEARNVKALMYLADKHLGREDFKKEDDSAINELRHLAALSPEERRKRIVELTKKVAI